jgi:hypothetical protein
MSRRQSNGDCRGVSSVFRFSLWDGPWGEAARRVPMSEVEQADYDRFRTEGPEPRFKLIKRVPCETLDQ